MTDNEEAERPRPLAVAAIPVAAALGLSILLRMGTTVLATRLSTVEQFGNFATINAVSAFVCALAMGGWPSYLIAVVPKQGVSRGLVRTMVSRLALSCLLLGLLQSAFLWLSLQGRVGLASLALAAMLVTTTTFATAFNEAQRATGNVLRSRLAIAIIPPVTTGGGLAITFAAAGPLSSVALIFWNAAGWLALWLWAAGWLRKAYVADPQSRLNISRRDLMLAKVSQAALATADVFIVGWVLGPAAGAVYAVASRVATTAGIGHTAVVMAFGPRLSRLAGDQRALSALVRRMTLLGGGFTVPIALTVAILSPQILSLFGAEYAASYWLLCILLAGVSANALAGPIGLIVNVTGQEGIARRTLLVASFVFVCGLPPVALQLGIYGVAVFWVVMTVAWNAALWVQVDLGRKPPGSPGTPATG